MLEETKLRAHVDLGNLIAPDYPSISVNVMTFPKWEGIYQPNVWLSSMLYCLKEHPIEEIHLGYVIGDHANSYFHEMNELFIKMQTTFISDHTPIKLVTPFSKLLKEHILMRYVDEFDRRLRDYIWSCEYPVGDKQCGTCVPCSHSLLRNNRWEPESEKITSEHPLAEYLDDDSEKCDYPSEEEYEEAVDKAKTEMSEECEMVLPAKHIKVTVKATSKKKKVVAKKHAQRYNNNE